MKPYYQRGGVTIYHGDQREVLPRLEAGAVNLFLTDPPYGLNFNVADLAAHRELALGHAPERGAPPGRPIAQDSPEEWGDLMRSWLREIPRLAHPDCCCCCCCCSGGGGPSPTFAVLTLMLDEAPLEFVQALVWDKGGLGLGWRYRRSYEFVLVAKIRGRKLPWYDETRTVSNVLRVPKILPRHDDHPTLKPVSLMERLIALHTRPGDLIVDPFAGSGTTLVAAAKLGRRAVGVEVDERWAERAARRLERGDNGAKRMEAGWAPLPLTFFESSTPR